MNAPTPACIMRTLLVGCGPIAHLAKGKGPVCGAEMSNVEELVSPKGMGILIENGIICQISNEQELLEEYAPWVNKESTHLSTSSRNRPKLSEFTQQDGTRILNLGGSAIIPGLIDSHSHLLWAGDRSQESLWRAQGKSYAEIAQLGGGIGYTVAETRQSSKQDLLNLGINRLQTALRNGTTKLEAKSGYGLTTESELLLLDAANELQKISGLPALDLTWLGAHDTPPSAMDANLARKSYVESILSEQLPQVLEQNIARSADVFCEPGWFTIEETAEILSASKKGGLDLRIHVDEFKDGGGLELAAEIEVTTADHAHHSSDDARQKAHDAGVMQGFLPGTPYVMGEESPPLLHCQNEGWMFSIATDYNPNCMTLSLPFIGSLAVNRGGLDPLAALVACTRNSGHTIANSSAKPHGMIVEGGVADLNILSSRQWQYWCLSPGDSPFTATMIAGELHKHNSIGGVTR